MKEFDKELFLNEFGRLTEIMAILRGDEGCPWDREQDHGTLMPYLIEEAYEVIESIEENSPEKLCEELGDLMLQIVFHSEIARQKGDFHIGDVLDSINRKLIRRHPHIFADVKVNDSGDVVRNWEEIKLKEKGRGKRKSLMEGIPGAMPALLYARRLQERAAGVGFDWEDIGGVVDKAHEEIDELKAVIDSGDREKVAGELGDLLFVLVNLGRWMDINPEEALRKTAKKFKKRFSYIEKEAKEKNKLLSEMGLYEMEEIWQDAKKYED